jgi:hypothetical protein
MRIPELIDVTNYIAEFSAMMKRHIRGDLLRSCRRWELHLRPVLNLKRASISLKHSD